MQLTGQSYRYRSATILNTGLDNDNGRTTRRILCLHGWMDNCRSFYYFAPHLLEQLRNHDDDDIHLVALDLPGHGRSSHHGDQRPSMVLAEAVVYVAEALRALEWNDTTTTTTTRTKMTLVGHSMGAAIACLYAAAFPEHVGSLILIEGAGPVARPAGDAAKHVRSHVEKRLTAAASLGPPRRYETIELAVAARCRTARTWPGNQYISETAALQLVEWGTTRINQQDIDDTDPDDKGVQFRHDPRLQWPSLQFFTQDQTDGVYRDIQCPTALITAVHGWPFSEEIRNRTLELLKPVHQITLPGSHHFHMDPDTAQSVVAQAAQFLKDIAVK
jgi:pimeloyl-ACP methyl ester carboxylesterase